VNLVGFLKNMECKNMHCLNNIKLVNDEFLHVFGRIIYDLFAVCLHLPGRAKNNHKKTLVVVGIIMAENSTGHLLHMNPNVTAP
jgi:hypothetical protein